MPLKLLSDPARLPTRTVVLSITALWACYFLIATARGIVIGLDTNLGSSHMSGSGVMLGLETNDGILWRRLVVTVSGIAITIVFWLVLRAFDARALWARVAVVLLAAIPASLLIAQVNQLVFAPIRTKAVERMAEAQGVKLRYDGEGNLLLFAPPELVNPPVLKTDRRAQRPLPDPPPPPDLDVPGMPELGADGPLSEQDAADRDRAFANWAKQMAEYEKAVTERAEKELQDARSALAKSDGALKSPSVDPESSDDSQIVLVASTPTVLDRWRDLSSLALTPYFLLIAWAALYLALLTGAQARLAERRAGEFARAAKTAELRSLRYQVNPHFLFNTLNSLSALVMTGKNQRAEEMIQNLSSFYRHSLTDDPTGDVPLEDEFALQRHYLDVEAVRFPDRLRAEFDLPPDLAEARVPGMILQPLVENSVKYGVAPLTRPVTIKLSARRNDDRLQITVSDDGRGEHDLGNHGFGIGLANVVDRLQARFGDSASVQYGARAGGSGYRTELQIPLVKYGK